MKEVGDKFGAGELILPFVLQSAEVMKRAVAQLERYLDKLEGYTKGTVVVATVFGDVHDIGKSLVNTILTNNGYTVVDLGKQVPIQTILDAAAGAQRRPRSGCPRCWSRPPSRCPRASRSCTRRAATFPVLIGGAAINRNFGLRILYPNGTESDEIYEPGVFYCKDAFEGLAKMDQLDRPRAARGAGGQDPRRGPQAARAARSRARRRAAGDRRLGPQRGEHTNPIPEPPFWGAREIEVPMDEVYRHLDTHVLFKLHWGGRGVKGEEWQRLLREDFQPRLERMWREQDYLHPRALLGYFPCNSDGNELIVWDPRISIPPTRASSSVWCSRASPSTTASAWPTSTGRSTAARSTSSRCRRSPPAARSPS